MSLLSSVKFILFLTFNLGGGIKPAFEENQVVLWDDKLKKNIGAVVCKSPIKNVKLQKNL
jgi:hypothetical protein